MIRPIGVAAGRHRVVLVQRRDQRDVHAVKHALRDGLRPGVFLIRLAEVHGGIPQQILVEIPSGHAPVPGLILRLHIRQQQLQLLRGDAAVAGVGRQVQVIQHQLPAALRRDAADGIAAVQIQQLHEAALHRQLHPLRRRDGRTGERQQPRPGRAVGRVQRVHKIRRIVVLREHAAFVGQRRVQRLTLVQLVRAGRPDVHLLQEIEIRLPFLQKRCDALHVGGDSLLAPRTGLRAAVHEKAVVRLVCAEADVVGDHGVRLPGLHRPVRVRRLHRCQLHVAQPVVVNEHIGHVAAYQQHHGQHRAQQRFDPFFHVSRLPRFTFF